MKQGWSCLTGWSDVMPTEIFSKMSDKENLIAKLAEMYNEPIMTLLDEPSEKEGNVNWTVNW